MIAIVALELSRIRVLGTARPANITTGDARLALESLLSMQGVTMAVTAIAVGAYLGREAVGDRAFNRMVSTIVVFPLSVLNAFVGLRAIGPTGFTNAQLVQPLGFLIYGTSVLGYGLALCLVRGYDRTWKAATIL